MEKVARAMLGGSSGSVLAILLAGFLRAGPWLMMALMLALGAGMALLHMRQLDIKQPAPPRALWAGILMSAALLVTLGVFLFQSVYIETTQKAGGKVDLPLPVWPVTSKGLWAAGALAGLGLIAALIALADAARDRRSGGGKWIAQALLAGGAALGLALACYLMGSGLTFGV